VASPAYASVDPVGLYLWEWYFSLSDTLQRVREGVCWRIPPTEFQAWRAATGVIVYPSEYAILCAMDAEFCAEVNSELEARRAKEAGK
jgi:hypothetical protein